MKKIFALFFTLVSLHVYAQESSVSMPDNDWGERQHTKERIAYWHAIEMSGPDTNIAEARLRGYRDFTSMARPKQAMIQSVAAWTQVGGSQDNTVSGRPTSIAFDPKNTAVI